MKLSSVGPWDWILLETPFKFLNLVSMKEADNWLLRLCINYMSNKIEHLKLSRSFHIYLTEVFTPKLSRLDSLEREMFNFLKPYLVCAWIVGKDDQNTWLDLRGSRGGQWGLRWRSYEDRLIETEGSEGIWSQPTRSCQERTRWNQGCYLGCLGMGQEQGRRQGCIPSEHMQCSQSWISRRYSFSQRVFNSWNSLPDSLKGVETVLVFKVGYNEWVEGGRVGAWGPERCQYQSSSQPKLCLEVSRNVTCVTMEIIKL